VQPHLTLGSRTAALRFRRAARWQGDDHQRRSTGGAAPSHASSRIPKVLVANRGEIAVRVIRAAEDAGIPSVAVYAEPDADAPHVRLADDAFALGGQTSAESYLDFGKLLDAAEKSGARDPHGPLIPLNAVFAQALIDADLIRIGPSPYSIRDLGDNVTALHRAA
jgi:acetyl-CoA/propionyl-CoA carboxylase biotin carboxyl carrier protein